MQSSRPSAAGQSARRAVDARHLLAVAAEVGPATSEPVGTLLDDRVVDRHTRVMRILRLHSQVGETRLEGVCARLLAFGDLATPPSSGC